MSYETNSPVSNGACCNALPGWISSGIIGMALGAGATFLGMQDAVPKQRPSASAPSAPSAVPALTPVMGGSAPPMGMGGMGGGGGGGGKRALTSFVGKLELLSRPDFKLHVELDADQANSIAAKLQELDKNEAMTAEQAQEQLEALESLLTSEQKEVLAAIGLPFGRGGGRPGAGGPMAGGAGPAAGAPPAGGMMGMGAASNPNENPFTQEVNQKRLKDLLGRLAPATSNVAEKSE